MIPDLTNFQKTINYNFQDIDLLKMSIIHRSYLSDKHRDPSIKNHNERLEFLGDAVLELVVTEHLYINYKDDEGYLTALRSALVNYKIMGQIGNELGMEELICISSGERAELGKARLTIVADAIEAVLGAIYLDGGYNEAKKFIDSFVLPKLEVIINTQSYKDPKTILQEYMQSLYHETPIYHTVSSEGKDHEKIFEVAVIYNNQTLAKGIGKSKQEAQSNAAALALVEIQKENSKTEIQD
jgi:ribonuclease III